MPKPKNKWKTGNVTAVTKASGKRGTPTIAQKNGDGNRVYLMEDSFQLFQTLLNDPQIRERISKAVNRTHSIYHGSTFWLSNRKMEQWESCTGPQQSLFSFLDKQLKAARDEKKKKKKLLLVDVATSATSETHYMTMMIVFETETEQTYGVLFDSGDSGERDTFVLYNTDRLRSYLDRWAAQHKIILYSLHNDRRKSKVAIQSTTGNTLCQTYTLMFRRNVKPGNDMFTELQQWFEKTTTDPYSEVCQFIKTILKLKWFSKMMDDRLQNSSKLLKRAKCDFFKG